MNLQIYVDYLNDAGNGQTKIEYFDEDWQPIGPRVRRELVDSKLAEEVEGRIIRLIGIDQEAILKESIQEFKAGTLFDDGDKNDKRPVSKGRYRDQIDADKIAIQFLDNIALKHSADRIEWNNHEKDGRSCSIWKDNTLLAYTIVFRDLMNWSIVICQEVEIAQRIEDIGE